MPAPKLALTAARRRALTVLVGAPAGVTEAAMMMHGFALDFIAELVRAGLASEHSGRVGLGKKGEIPVLWLRITEAGRRALA